MRKEKQTNKQTTDVKEKAKTQSKGKHGYGAVAAVVIAVGAAGYVAYRMVRKLFVPKKEPDPADAGAEAIPENAPETTDDEKDGNEETAAQEHTEE